MPSETSTCPGCDETFTLRGYESHLTQTTDPLCRAVYEELKMAHTLYERLTKVQIPFQGDTFGSAEDYAGETFGQDEVDEHPSGSAAADEPPQTDESEEEEEEIAQRVAELENSWEPAREGAPVEGPVAEQAVHEELDKVDEGPDEDAGARRTAERVIIGDGHGVKPAVIVRYTDKYPTSAAGGVLTQEEAIDRRYRDVVSGKDNPWAPFKSKMDWEVALWAKLRGAGSTAFTDLLSVGGVRYTFNKFNLNKILTGKPLFDRSVKRSTCHTRTRMN